MKIKPPAIATALAVAGAVVYAAGGSAGTGKVVGSTGEEIDATAAARGGFPPHVDNPPYPLKPGPVMRYRGTEGGVKAIDVLHPTHRTKLIAGVRCRVVRDRLFKHGKLR